MGTNKTKLPIAAIFFAVACLRTVLGVISWFGTASFYFRHYHQVQGIFTSILSIILALGSAAAAGYVAWLLYKDKRDMHTAIAASAFFGISLLTDLVSLFSGFSLWELLSILAKALQIFILLSDFVPRLSEYKEWAAKLWFVPGAYFALRTFISAVSTCYLSTLFGFILTVVIATPLYLLSALWFVDPEGKILPYRYITDIGSAQNSQRTADGSAAQPVSSDEAYCSLGKHVVLCLFTFGIWPLIWIYRTTNFLNSAPDAEYYNPTNKLLLCIFVPFYQIYWLYKHGQRIDNMSRAKNPAASSDMATTCLILGIFIPIVAVILMQDKINSFCAPAPVYAPQPAAQNTDTAEELKKFKALLDEGVITQEDYDEKKRRLLGL